jgi:membrane-associated phospholipid phosphatase
LALPIRGVMQLGTLPAVGIVAGVLFAFAPRGRWQAAGAVIVAGIAARVASDALKDEFDRARPLESVTDVVPRDHADGLGFPSTHAAVAFALAGVVVWWLPRRWQAAAWALAAMVALARVYVGVHYPLDVVGGAAVGVVMASVAVACFGAPRRDLRAASSRSSTTARP